MTTELFGETVFELPGGLALDSGRCLTTAVLRPLLGREEEWLAHASEAPSAARVTRLLSSCLVSLGGEPVTSGLVRKLLVGDRDYLMLQVRRLSLGDDVHAVLTCPACAARMDVDFRVSEVPVEARFQEAPSYTMGAPDAERGERVIRFRLPTGGDQEDLVAMSVEEAADELLDRCVLDDGGRPLSSEERAAVVEKMERLAPQVDLELDLVCPECSHSFAAPFDTTMFFFEEMRINSRQLLREVHTLAFYYHWSESDILGLRRARRREYLGLLNETLRQD
jgi:hypothetical protein